MLYTEIPTHRPVTPLLDAIDHPQQLTIARAQPTRHKWRMSYVNSFCMQQDKAVDTLVQTWVSSNSRWLCTIVLIRRMTA